jgi:hypothetical protein
MFVQEKIETLKREWTDKYVVVAGDRPELRRFDGYTGQVKTVNMSGRALVQFDAWSNIGWYDIDPGYLTVVPKPDPAMAGKKVATKEAEPAAKAAAEPAAAAKPAAKGGRPSVAEMLAAARANKPAAAGAAATAEPVAKAAPVEKPVAAKPAAQRSGGVTALPKGQRPSIAQMLAYCREHDAKR